MRYRRSYVPGGVYFFTVNLRDRRSTLLVDKIDDLRASVRWVRNQYPFDIHAWVVLPDHLHAVWSLPDGDADYSSRWREIKKRFVKSLSGRPVGSPSPWQNRFWEHSIRDELDYQRHVDYVHWNPMKHKLVSRVVDWPYSSFHRAVAQGIYPEDWCGDIESDDGRFLHQYDI